ncbi:MAG: galactose mutarotase [Spirochaetales bacterium]|nr:galactose mutarotase [Spirochaetales bacterium]
MNKPGIERKKFGIAADGRQVDAFVLTNGLGLETTLITWGASVQSVIMPDKNGTSREITLGFDSLAGYEGDHPFFGCTVGRFANRIKNGRFTLDGKEYRLACNNAPNHLHGGPGGFHHVIWEAFPIKKGDSVSVKFIYSSPDGEEGFPGTADVSTLYTLNRSNELVIEWEAICDKPTPFNLTNHTYWNLSGQKGSVLEHRLQVNADRFLPMDDTGIPTGELRSVSGSGMDFSKAKSVGQDIAAIGGYDHCYVLNGTIGELRNAAILADPASGRKMEVFATQPAIHVYSGNYLGSFKSRLGTHAAHDAICLETEHFPDSPNHPDFPDCILKPGNTYTHRVVHRFSW